MWNLLDTWDNQSEQLNVDNLHIVKHVGIYWNIVGLVLIIYDNISEWFTDTIHYCMYYNISWKQIIDHIISIHTGNILVLNVLSDPTRTIYWFQFLDFAVIPVLLGFGLGLICWLLVWFVQQYHE